MTQRLPKRRTAIYLIATFLSLIFMGVIANTQKDRMIEGRNDFIPLYTGTRLLATGELYDNERLLQAEAELTGFSSETHGYIRPPFVAALMWPIGRLSYRSALRVWQVASLVALAGFVWFWDPQQRYLTALVTAMSIPALLVWLKGQDVLFLLLAIAVSARLHLAGRPLASGAVFALCAAKPHLFLLAPVWILARRDWGFLKGLLGGGAALAILSTLAAGWSWPLEMWREAQNPAFSPSVASMPNLHGALSAFPAAWLWEIALAVVAIWAVWTIAQRSSFAPALAAGLLGSVPLARHSYPLDLVLLIPAVLVVATSMERVSLKIVAVLLAAPPLLFFSIQGAPYSHAVAFLSWGLAISWALEVRKPPVAEA